MYLRDYHQEDNPEIVLQFIRDHPFCILVSPSDSFPVASHLPLEVDQREEGKIYFTGHMARGNPQWRTFQVYPQVLVIIQGPHSYISASWYTQPNVASTWNYLAVHCSGKIRMMSDHETLQNLKRLTDRFEAGRTHPTSLEKMPVDYVNRNLQAIVGFEIAVEKIENTFKLSQNKGEATRSNVITELRKEGDRDGQQIAEEMDKRLKGKGEKK
ncbi:MAG: FMN-binding negative transcriptional regulator [Chitinophagaceae bacterium]